MAARVMGSIFVRKASSVHSPSVSIDGRLRVAGCKKPLETPFMERAFSAMVGVVLAQFLQLQAGYQLNKKAARPAAFVGECEI